MIPTGGLTRFDSAGGHGAGRAGDTVVASPDLTGDGHADLLVRDTGGTARVLPGNGAGRLRCPGQEHRHVRAAAT